MTDDTKRPGWPADPPPTREELERPHDATLRLQELFQRRPTEPLAVLALAEQDAEALRDLLKGLHGKPCHYCLAPYHIPPHPSRPYVHTDGCQLERILRTAEDAVERCARLGAQDGQR